MPAIMPQTSGLNIGHRGAAAHAPENTLESMRLAFEQFKCGSIEFDIRFSKDRIPVVIHDATLDRTTNAKGYVYSQALQELQKHDAGYWFDPQKNKSYPFRGKGLRIPSFEQLLAAFPDKHLCVEIKEKEPAVTDSVMALIKKYKEIGRASCRERV
jgi:glycerophosphoryl diester phosphodiesterase